MKNKIRLGMVGGGKDAFIGAVHRMAARMDDKYDFVAGCLSSTPEKSKISAKEINLDLNRSKKSRWNRSCFHCYSKSYACKTSDCFFRKRYSCNL